MEVLTHAAMAGQVKPTTVNKKVQEMESRVYRGGEEGVRDGLDRGREERREFCGSQWPGRYL